MKLLHYYSETPASTGTYGPFLPIAGRKMVPAASTAPGYLSLIVLSTEIAMAVRAATAAVSSDGTTKPLILMTKLPSSRRRRLEAYNAQRD